MPTNMYCPLMDFIKTNVRIAFCNISLKTEVQSSLGFQNFLILEPSKIFGLVWFTAYQTQWVILLLLIFFFFFFQKYIAVRCSLLSYPGCKTYLVKVACIQYNQFHWFISFTGIHIIYWIPICCVPI